MHRFRGYRFKIIFFKKIRIEDKMDFLRNCVYHILARKRSCLARKAKLL